MPCPFFEPQRVAADPDHPRSRLPLLEEYEGLCHATGESSRVPRELRFRYCNHGYSSGSCLLFPLSEKRSCLRLNVLSASASDLEVLVVEESNHAPVSWRAVRYNLGTAAVDPELNDSCALAQVIAFCQSYLRRFSS